VSVLLLVGAALAGGLAMGLVYTPGDGLMTAGLLLLTGAPVLGFAHAFTHRRARFGSLSRQFAVGTGLTIALSMLAIGLVAALLFVSVHDAFTLALLLAFSGTLATYSARMIAGSALSDLEAVRDGVRAVGEGSRDVHIETSGHDELAELAEAGNRMVEQLSEREAAAEAADGARRSLMAAVSHDLRTPLASLRVLAEAIGSGVVDEATRERYAEQLGVHIQVLGALIDDLFELSRLEAGDIEWSTYRVRLDELVEETVEAMQPQAGARGIRTRSEVSADLPPARANPEKIQRVLFNLIQNAIRHTPADGTITVAAQPNGAHVEVEVADTGPGILSEERERAFEPFYRGGTDASRTPSGAGLGLTICRAIVEAHGGRIWLAESGTGTRVRFTLPSMS
jgi:signal transduction histidine kinase